MPETSAVSVESTWAVLLMAGAPVAGVFGGTVTVADVGTMRTEIV